MREKAASRPILLPAFTDNSIPVVFAANDRYIPIFAACLHSFLNHISPNWNYDIVLLESDVRQENMALLSGMVEAYPNVSLRFYNTLHMTKDYTLRPRGYISVETYYRFLIQDVLPQYDKVLYLDCDVIVNADVAELYQTDVEGYLLAAAHDADFLGQIHGASRDTQKYIKKTFRMKNPDNYFQAGVLLINEKEMRKAYSLDQWLTFAAAPYKYNDQDVLNLHCEGRVKFLDMSWNLLTDCDHTRISKVIVHAPKEIQEEYRRAYADPKIIHYAGHIKPWHKPTEDMAKPFWAAAKNTPYYEEMVYRMMQCAAREQILKDRRERSLLRKIWRFAKYQILNKDPNG